MKPCNSLNERSPSPYRALKALVDEFAHQPDLPLMTLQHQFDAFTIAYFNVITLAIDIAPWQLGLSMLELASTELVASIRNAVAESLGVIP